MSEQPGDLLDEAVKLFETLRRRLGETGGGAAGESGRAGADDDVWSRAVAEEPPRIATGAPECRDCPVCRAIAVARESRADVGTHVRQAGRSLLAAVLDVVAAYERTRGPQPPPHRRSGAGAAGGEDPIDIG